VLFFDRIRLERLFFFAVEDKTVWSSVAKTSRAARFARAGISLFFFCSSSRERPRGVRFVCLVSRTIPPCGRVSESVFFHRLRPRAFFLFFPRLPHRTCACSFFLSTTFEDSLFSPPAAYALFLTSSAYLGDPFFQIFESLRRPLLPAPGKKIAPCPASLAAFPTARFQASPLDDAPDDPSTPGRPAPMWSSLP